MREFENLAGLVMKSCLIKNFEECVQIFPGRTAVVYGNESVSYHQLNQKANLLAHYLIEIGVTRNSLVGVVLPRSIDFIVAILAIIKAGGCYIPIDPSFPTERINKVIDDAALSFLVTKTGIISLSTKDKLSLVNIDSFEKALKNFCGDDPSLASYEDDLIYVIYTSGSTGTPKGAVNTHKGFANLVEWYVADFGMNKDDNILIYTPLSFDLTQKNIFAPLMIGAKIFLYESTIYDPKLIAERICEYGITWINSTPSAFYPLVENDQDLKKLETLRYVFVGGEPLLAKRMLSIKKTNPKLNIINTYGPTECSDVCAFYWVSNKDFESNSTYVPIGKAIKSMELSVFNEKMEEVSPGEIGELYISGVGVGLGYLNNSELTKKAFVSSSLDGHPQKLFYKTGDLVRYLPDSTNIEFIERKDFQVKIRGYRVELEEISNILKSYPNVKDALVVAHGDKEDEKHIIAYVVAIDRQDVILDREDLKQYLQRFLPSYMIPAAILVVDGFPLTLNGKIDRKNLPIPKIAFSNSFDESLNIIERKLLDLWYALLPVQDIDVKDSFFQLGGHSLSAVKLIFRIRQEFGVNISIQDLFGNPTILSLAQRIGENKNLLRNQAITIKRCSDIHSEYPLSFPHKRIWYIEQTFKNPIIFNNLITLSIKGFLSVEKLEQALNQLVKRHEILRTSLSIHGTEPYEQLFDNFDFKLEKLDYTDENEDLWQEKIKEFSESVISIPFDLTRLPLIRVYVLKLRDDHHILVMCIHQFLIDGASMSVFYDELSKFYNNSDSDLSPLPVQYRDYAIWQNNELTEKNLEKQIEFWRHELNGAPKQIAFQLDKLRPSEFSYEGRVCTTFLPVEVVREINLFCKTHDVTLFMTLLSVYAVLLFNHSQDKDIVIGSPIANRSYGELEGLIGFFVNIIPYRIALDTNLSFTELVSNVKRFALAAYMNQDLPFIDLCNYLNIERDKSYHPIFQAVFAMQPYGVDSFKLDGLTVEDLDYEEPVAKFDLTLNASEKNGVIELKFEYALGLFLHSTIEGMAEEYEGILKKVILNPKEKIKKIVSFI